MEIRRAAQGVPRLPGRTVLPRVVDQDDCGLEFALQLSEKAEQGRHVGAGVLVLTVEPHERVEKDKIRPDGIGRGHQALLIGWKVDP